MSNGREKILARLRENSKTQAPSVPVFLPDHGWSQQQKTAMLEEKMSAVRTEVHRMPRSSWIDWINTELPARGLKNVLTGNTGNARLLIENADNQLHIEQYTKTIENWKEELFNQIEVGITDTFGGIAESGSLILWPDEKEPRLMSLVPPVHIALLEADKIYETFAQAVHHQQWHEHMPTNALLISGPSKTADIEQTLAYGIHGPKQLIVLILE